MKTNNPAMHAALSVLTASFFCACNLINPAEPTPAYITIDTVALVTNPVTQGSASSKITDAWVYIDDQPVGTYELPARFPVLFSGTHKISIQGGILLNGINATHVAYPYYQFMDTTVELVPGQETNITNLITSYYPAVTFDMNEDFESLVPFLRSDNSPVGMTSGNDPVQRFEGTYGIIKVDTGMYNFEVKSNLLTLNNDGTTYYLEMDYKNSAPFEVVLQAEDLQGNTQKNTIITLLTKPEWNKIYIELRPTLQITPNSTRFRILFGQSRVAAGSTEEFYFDNIKLVHN